MLMADAAQLNKQNVWLGGVGIFGQIIRSPSIGLERRIYFINL